MSASSLERKQNPQENLRQQFAQLRENVHEAMKVEEAQRLKENPTPTEEELYMGAFREWLEPQVRTAIEQMYKKGYATESSGFHATDCKIQMLDGYFTINPETKGKLEQIGVEVLRGADLGVPKNKSIRILRFRAQRPSIEEMRSTWDEIAAILPPQTFPDGVRPICDRAEEFREEFAPNHTSLEAERTAYFDYIRTVNQ